MRRLLVFLSLIMLVSFKPVPKEISKKALTNVTLTYGTSTTPGCYGVFMYNYDDATEYFFTFSGSYGTLGTVTEGTYFVSINEITPYCDGYNNRTFQAGSMTLYNHGTQADLYPTTINASNSYVIVW
jgi:hypothetical protein